MKQNPELRRNIYLTVLIHALLAIAILLGFVYAVAHKAGG